MDAARPARPNDAALPNPVVDAHVPPLLPDTGLPGLGPFSPPTALEMFDGADDPSLTADGLELFFDSGGKGQVQVATRPTRNAPWGIPEDVIAIGPGAPGTTPWVTPDGLQLYFAATREGGTGGRDIWWMKRATRTSEWTSPLELASVNTKDGDFAPGLSESRLEFVLTRAGGDLTSEELFISNRTTTTGIWQLPVAAPVNDPDAKDSDAVFADGDLELWWVRGVSGRGNELFVATRQSTSESFANPQPVPELNSTRDEGDPWISPDGREVMFYSNRDGQSRLYRATR